MKKNVVLLIIGIFLIGVCIVFLTNKNWQNEIQENEIILEDISTFTNSIIHRGDYLSGYYSRVYVFLEDGEYYYFNPQYDALVREKAYKGKWEIVNNQLRLTVEKEVYLNGGSIVDVEEDDQYINQQKIVNGKLTLIDSEKIFSIKVEILENLAGKYSEALEIKEDSLYYSIYKYETSEQVKEKLEEMYGEVFLCFETL